MVKKFVIDLKDSKSEMDVFNAFHFVFRDLFKYYSWRIHTWDGLDDFLWGMIQGPEQDGTDLDFYKDIDEIYIRVINSQHLRFVHAELVKRFHISVLQALQDSFDHIKREQAKRATPDDLPIFRNSKMEIIS